MAHSRTPRRLLSRSLTLLAVLAITTGWSEPAHAVPSPAGATSATVYGASRESLWATREPFAAVPAAVSASRRTETTSVERRPPIDRSAPPAATAVHPAATGDLEARSTAKSKAQDEAPATYRGRNHFWIPSLGMSYGVRPYGCGQTFYPGNYIYRWGCAGRNNVYILGHAHSVMKPLHDLYVSGNLRRGMIAVFANASGQVTKYRVTEWRVVRPTEIAWQIAAQPVPSMTLQTCVGKDSQYRLNVRLVAVGY